MTERNITVTGVGTVSLKPDLVIISMSIEKTDLSYSTAMELSEDAINALREALASVGYDRDSLKTVDFNIDTDYESYQDEKGNWSRRFAGYKCSHSLKLEIDFDMEALNKTLSAIATSGAEPEYSISFTVKDKTAATDRLLALAVKNATDKAAVLAKAANVTLGAIKSINYSWEELHLLSETRVTPKCYARADNCISMDIRPEDIKASDTVTVIWNIN